MVSRFGVVRRICHFHTWRMVWVFSVSLVLLMHTRLSYSGSRGCGWVYGRNMLVQLLGNTHLFKIVFYRWIFSCEIIPMRRCQIAAHLYCLIIGWGSFGGLFLSDGCGRVAIFFRSRCLCYGWLADGIIGFSPVAITTLFERFFAVLQSRG